MSGSSQRALRLGTLAIALVVAVWVLGFAPRGFFSGDSGVKLVQAYGLWSSGFSSRALPYDHELDPDERFFPYQRQDFTRVVDGERQGTYSVTFCALAALVLGLLGRAGLALPALLGAALMAWGMLRVCEQTRMPTGPALAGIAAALLASPALFYSSQLAEHTLAAGLAVCAYALIAPAPTDADADAEPARAGRAAAAGAVAAVAATFRPEGYCMLAALGLAVAASPGLTLSARIRRCLGYLAGSVPIVAGYWLLNLATADTWDPLVSANTRPDKVAAARLTNVLLWGELPGGTRPWQWLAAAALPALVGLLPERVRGRPLAAVARSLAAVAVVVVAVRAQQLGSGRVLAGLFSVTPVLAFGLLAGPWGPRRRGPWLCAALFLLQLAVLPSGGNAGGLQLGARLLMPAVPFLCLLVSFELAGVDRARAARVWPRRVATAAALVLALASLRGLSVGMPQAVDITAKGAAFAQAAHDAPASVIIARRGWESQLAATVLLDGKELYEVRGSLIPLARALLARGTRAFAVVAREPIEAPLDRAHRLRTVSATRGWLDLQHVVIDGP